jgi:DNA-binding NtrC family response regulator
MKGAKILLVDDEVVFTQNVSRLLTSRGYRVAAVNSGEDAIAMLEKEDFDVVVLDLKMPGLDGIATLREIKKLPRFTETLILTGHGSIDTALEAVKIGAYDYLSKPCEIEELLAKIEGAFEKKGGEERKELSRKIEKIVESPAAVFDLFPPRKK